MSESDGLGLSRKKATAVPGGSMPPTARGADGKLTRRDLHAKGKRFPVDGEQTASVRGGLTFGTTTDPYRAAKKTEARAYGVNEWVREALPDQTGLSANQSGTSIFDPVLCELVYRWFCPPGGLVLDPFAGGSVRGVVASKLGRAYLGVELRPEQVAANRAQGAALCDEPRPAWVEGDAIDLATLGGPCDLVFSCPPYADLEVYSDNPRDLSTMDYPAFLDAYRAIIAAAVGWLRDDRFAAFVVGDLRDKAGFYRGFVSDTVDAFEAAGARLYNEAILITAVGSLPIRVARMFESARKLGKTHQNLVVFVKGDPKRATEAVGPVEFGAPAEAEAPVEV